MSERTEMQVRMMPTTIYTCDRCGRDDIAVRRKCEVCSDVLCDACRGRWIGDDELFHYDTFVCEVCWQLGTEERNAVEAAEDACENARTVAIAAWKEKAKR